ncbi:hypothetical protein RQP46_008099 [Phenoliferia psychrophenolica]
MTSLSHIPSSASPSPKAIIASTSARVGSSNVAGWSIDGVSYTRLPASPLPSSSSIGASSGGGVNTMAVGLGAGLGGAFVLAAATVLAILHQRRKTRRSFAKKTRALSEMRSANFAPDIPSGDRV